MKKVPCHSCGSEEIAGTCMICEIELCSSCIVICSQKGTGACDQKVGEVVIYQCTGTYCQVHAKEYMIFICKECKEAFCKTAIEGWAKPCPTCKDYICGKDYTEHVKGCTDFYDKEKALNKLFKLVDGDKSKKS